MNQNLFVKCKVCGSIIENKKLLDNSSVCSSCGYYETLNYEQRLSLIVDQGTFTETNICTTFYNPINFPGYLDKHESIKNKTDLNETIITGRAEIYGHPVMIGVMDTRYMMGSMGIIVGEKVTRLFEDASIDGIPVIMFVASGGARMQEGIFSLMQMAKTAAAVSTFGDLGGLYISVLTNPTTGGVSASFAFLGDIIISEPGALIGFAGKRVIAQTVKEELPVNFQTAEFLLERGYLDLIIKREDLRNTLSKLLRLHDKKEVLR
ncbi:MAG: acetyl-CoA carboxylase carboxyl transferase subunit beta [Anaerocolumna sp.]|jgi:acetyl-CoA carboxylase carboxyl transferase subunit beta|nr:acetyl-CoA carboxylase carboxyl transferase subunit beta [Anaerocolumna sp.]